MSTLRRYILGNGQNGLFKLLLILILGAVTFHGSHAGSLNSSKLFQKFKEQKIILRGGDSFKLDYQLKNRCSERHVQMKYGGKRGRVNARGKQNSQYTQLTFVSEAGGVIRIQGYETKKFLCFSKKGRLVLRFNGHRRTCAFREELVGEASFRFRSEVKSEWYVGFRRNGRPLPGYAIKNSKKEKCFNFYRKPVQPPRTRTHSSGSPIHGVDPNKLRQTIENQRRWKKSRWNPVLDSNRLYQSIQNDNR